MNFPEMIVAVVLISSVAGVLKEWGKKERGAPKLKELLSELKALREEVRLLRQQNNDVLLNLDSTVDRLGERVDRLETRTASGQEVRGEDRQYVGRAGK